MITISQTFTPSNKFSSGSQTMNIKDNLQPPISALQKYLDFSFNKKNSSVSSSLHAPLLVNLAHQIQHNLEHQHFWSRLVIHFESSLTHKPLPRPLIAGLPPKRLYIHPDEQTELLKHDIDIGPNQKLLGAGDEKHITTIGGRPEMEWVLPTHVGENWSLKALAEVFDAIVTVPQSVTDDDRELEQESDDQEIGWEWRGAHRQKRLLMATVHDDSTVVYYIIHDGIVKPRQN